jgi:UDP-glucose 4-epimerase
MSRALPDIVVTGGSGFLGRAVVNELAKSGQVVTRVTRREHAPQSGVADLKIVDYRNLPEKMEQSILIHAGEPADIGAAQAAGEGHMREVEGLLDTLLARRFARVVYISSAAVYGEDLQAPRRPDEPISPCGIYARGKASCEAKVLARGGAVVRLSNLFGPGMARNTLIGDLLAQIPGRDPLRLRDDRPVRDYVFVMDAARAVAACATRPVSGVVNVGSGVGTSAGSLARIMLDMAGETERPVVATAASDRPSHLVLDISQTKTKLDWQPQVSLADGLNSMIKSAA